MAKTEPSGFAYCAINGTLNKCAALQYNKFEKIKSGILTEALYELNWKYMKNMSLPKICMEFQRVVELQIETRYHQDFGVLNKITASYFIIKWSDINNSKYVGTKTILIYLRLQLRIYDKLTHCAKILLWKNGKNI